MEVDTVIMAVGRNPNIQGLSLNNTHVKLNPTGTIKVDDF